MGSGQSSAAKRGSHKNETGMESNRKFESYHLPFMKKKKQSKLSKHLTANKNISDVRKKPLLPLPPDIYQSTRFQRSPNTPETYPRATRPLLPALTGNERNFDDVDLYSNLTRRTERANDDDPQYDVDPSPRDGTIDHRKYTYNYVNDLYASVKPSPALAHRPSHDSSSEDKSTKSDNNQLKPDPPALKSINNDSPTPDDDVDDVPSVQQLIPKLHRSSCDSSSEDKSGTSVFEDASDDLIIVYNVSRIPTEAPLTEESSKADEDYDKLEDAAEMADMRSCTLTSSSTQTMEETITDDKPTGVQQVMGQLAGHPHGDENQLVAPSAVDGTKIAPATKGVAVKVSKPKKLVARPKAKNTLRPKKVTTKSQSTNPEKKGQVVDSKSEKQIPKKASQDVNTKSAVTFTDQIVQEKPQSSKTRCQKQSPITGVKAKAVQPLIKPEEKPQATNDKGDMQFIAKSKVEISRNIDIVPPLPKVNNDVKETKEAMNIKLSQSNFSFKPTNIAETTLSTSKGDSGITLNSLPIEKLQFTKQTTDSKNSPSNLEMYRNDQPGQMFGNKPHQPDMTRMQSPVNTTAAATLGKIDTVTTVVRDDIPSARLNCGNIQPNTKPESPKATTVSRTRRDSPKPPDKLDVTGLNKNDIIDSLQKHKIHTKPKLSDLTITTQNLHPQTLPKLLDTSGSAASVKNYISNDSKTSNQIQPNPKHDDISAATLKMLNTHQNMIRSSESLEAAMALSELNQKYSKVAEDLCNLLANSCHEEDFLTSLEELADSKNSEPHSGTKSSNPTPKTNTDNSPSADVKSITHTETSSPVVTTPKTSITLVTHTETNELVAVTPINHTVSNSAVVPAPTARKKSTSPVVSTPNDRKKSTSPVTSTPNDIKESGLPLVPTPNGEKGRNSPVVSTPITRRDSSSPVVPTPSDRKETDSPIVAMPNDHKESSSPIVSTPSDCEKDNVSNFTSSTQSTSRLGNNSPILPLNDEHFDNTAVRETVQPAKQEDPQVLGLDNLSYSATYEKELVEFPPRGGKRSDSSSLSSDNENMILVNDSSSNGTSASDMTDDVWEDDETSNKDLLSANEIKTKLVEDLIKSSEVNLGDFQQFLEISTSISKKYHYLPIDDLLRRNFEIGVPIDGLGRCLRVLAKYGLDLMKPEEERQDYSKKIVSEDNLFQTDFQQMPGITDILKCLGYEEQEEGFVFAGSNDDDPISLAVWVIEMLLAAHELNYYNLGIHPQPQLLDVYFKNISPSGSSNES